MTFASTSGNISASAFASCSILLTGRGGLAGGISVASSENLTPGFGDFDVGGGVVFCSVVLCSLAGRSVSSSKSSGRAVVGDSAPDLSVLDLEVWMRH